MKQTIILSGGLGNQMFQYAFFLSMKAKGKSCSLDTTLFQTNKMHNGFELKSVFDIPDSPNQASALHSLLIKMLRRYKPKSILTIDEPYTFCPDALESKKSFLMGDWLSPKYFESIKDVVVIAYRFHNICNKNVDTANEMHGNNSVSIHIRRGDYLKLPYYCVCNENYYRQAIEQIKDRVDNPIFYVFSNEPSWCDSFMKEFRVNFKIVNWNQGKDSYQDMYLMTQCKHNIIANSTFSWWGAWLNNNTDKIIVAPSKWFKNSEHNINCKEWLLIDTSK